MNDLYLELKHDLLTEGEEDFLGFWEFLWHVHETLGIDDDRAARMKTMELIQSYLEDGLIVPGFPIGNGPDFAAWSLPIKDAIVWMTEGWDKLDREPITGDICWFVTSEKGKEWLHRYREERRGRFKSAEDYLA